MSKIITFGNTILAESGKRGSLKPMEAGGEYYKLNAGGFNIPNRMGVVYRFNEYLKECMRPGSDLNRRVSEGQVQMELGHPPQYYFEKDPRTGQVVRTNITEVFQWIHRLRTILDPNVCGFIRKIHWEMTGRESDPIYNYIEARPFGAYKEVFKDSLEDPDINTAVSIRTVTKPQKMGDTSREVDYFSTYDLVIEQGMIMACKHRTAGLEDILSNALESPKPATMETTYDEFKFLWDKHKNNDRLMARFEGTESFNRIDAMVSHLDKIYKGDKKIHLVNSNSLGVFG